MNYSVENLGLELRKGKFFDFGIKPGAVITDYSQIDREIVVSRGEIDGRSTIRLGDLKIKKEINSIIVLKEAIAEMMLEVQSNINRDSVYGMGIDLDEELLAFFSPVVSIKPLPLRIDICHEDRELLIDQIIFDILCNKYLAESPQMTLQEYSASHSNYIWNGVAEAENKIDAVRKCLSRAMQRQSQKMNRENIEKLGVNPDMYFEYIRKFSAPFCSEKDKEARKPKTVWDYYYYNNTKKLITSKQYGRSFNKNQNYSRAAVADLFDTYDRFVDEVFMQKANDSKDYFMKSIEFYYLEIYKRIDFIYRLAVRLENTMSTTIDKDHPLVKRFHPEVLVVCADKGLLNFYTKHSYYRPMLMLEEQWQQKKRYDEASYWDTLQKHHLIRAKTYELFKYHYRFVSDDYDDISNFIQEHYDVLNYYQADKTWIQPDKERKAESEARIIKALEINKALFGDLVK